MVGLTVSSCGLQISNFIIVLLVLSLELLRRLLSIFRGVRLGIAYVQDTQTVCPLTDVASYEGEHRRSVEDEPVVATVKAYPLHTYPDARLVHSKLQAMGDTAYLSPVYGCETEGGILFMATKPSTTTLSEHIVQFRTCPIVANDFCISLTKATLQLHMAGQFSWVPVPFAHWPYIYTNLKLNFVWPRQASPTATSDPRRS
jgi:hypothetical protein